MEKAYENGGFSYYKYKPKIFKPFYINLEPISFRRRIRFFLAYFSGYEVYYMAKGAEYIGYCVIQSGRDKRYSFAGSNDIIVGPYFIREDFRGRKLSVTLLDVVLKRLAMEFNYAYDYIQKTNIPSIKASCRVGFEYMSDATVTKLTRKLILLEKDCGDYCIFRYRKQHLEELKEDSNGRFNSNYTNEK